MDFSKQNVCMNECVPQPLALFTSAPACRQNTPITFTTPSLQQLAYRSLIPDHVVEFREDFPRHEIHRSRTVTYRFPNSQVRFTDEHQAFDYDVMPDEIIVQRQVTPQQLVFENACTFTYNEISYILQRICQDAIMWGRNYIVSFSNSVFDTLLSSRAFDILRTDIRHAIMSLLNCYNMMIGYVIITPLQRYLEQQRLTPAQFVDMSSTLLQSGDIETNPGPIPEYIVAQMRDIVQSLSEQECREFIFHHYLEMWYLHCKYFRSPMTKAPFLATTTCEVVNELYVHDLTKDGDVEANPGPSHSKLSCDVERRHNDPRRLQAIIDRQNEMIKDLRKQIRKLTVRHSKHDCHDDDGIYAQMFGIRDIAESLDRASQNAPDFTRNLTRICNFLEAALPQMQASLSATVLTFADNVSELSERLVQIVVICLIVNCFFGMKRYRTALLAVLAFLAMYYKLPQTLYAQVKEIIASYSTETVPPLVESAASATRIHAQMDVEEFVYSTPFLLGGKILFAFLAFFAIKQIPGKKDWDNLILRLDRIPKAVSGTSKIWEMSTSAFNIVHDQVKQLVLGKTSEELHKATDLYPRIEAWAAKVRHYLELDERDKIDTTPETATIVESLWREGLAFAADKDMDAKATRLVMVTNVAAKQLYEYVSCSPVKGGGPRMRPVCVWLIGESGVGKTEMVYPLCIDVLRTMGLISPRDFHHQVYARQVETEFWDGYKNQKVVIYDDAFQMKDNATTPNPELFEVIRSCNTFPQHLHMAALHDKNTFSSAELMLYTTNRPLVEVDSLTFPEAFFNRMNEHAYRVTPKDEYLMTTPDGVIICPPKLDKSKLDPTQPIDLSIYKFQKVLVTPTDLSNPTTDVGSPICYEEFAKIICDDWRKRKQDAMDKLRFLENYATRPVVAQMLPEEYHDAITDYTDQDIERMITAGYAAGKEFHEIQADFAMDDDLFAAFMRYNKKREPPSRWQKHLDRISVCYQEFKTYLTQKTQQVKEIVSSHPILTAIGIVGVVVAGFGAYKYMFSDDDEEEELRDKDRLSHQVKSDKSWPGRVIDKLRPRKQQYSVWWKCPEHVAAMDHARNADDARAWWHEHEDDFGCTEWHSFVGIDDEKVREHANFFRSQRYMDCISSDSEEEVTFELGSSGDVKTMKAQRVRTELATSGDSKTTKAQRITVQNAHDALSREFLKQKKRINPQAASDVNAHELVVNTLRDSTYRMTYVKNDKHCRLGNVTFLRGWTAIMPYHYITGIVARRLPTNTILYMSQPGKPNIIQFPVSHIVDDFDVDGEILLSQHATRLVFKDGSLQDAVVFDLHGKICHMHKDITKLFVKTDDQADIVGKSAAAYTTFHKDEHGDLLRAYQYVRDLKPSDTEIYIQYPEDGYEYGDGYRQREAYTYSAPTQDGDCGSVLTIHDNRMARKLVGMHIAGSSGRGYCTPITQEKLNFAFEKLGVHCQFYFEPDKNVIVDSIPEVPEGSFVPVGKSKLRVGQARKTTLQPSAIYGCITEPLTRPAALSRVYVDGEMIDPLRNGLKKCGFQPPCISQTSIDACSKDVSRIVRTQFNDSVSKTTFSKILTYEQAILGADDDFMSSLNRTTSPGFPYVSEKRGRPGKTMWLGLGQEYDLTSDKAKQLQKDVEQLIEDCKVGKMSNVYWIDSLKDERREHAKVALGKTRVFSASPMHFTIAFRKYYLPFAAWCMHNRIDNEIAVGTNVYSYDWHKLSTRLRSKGDRVVAGDFSNFDGSLNAMVLWALYNNIYVPWAEEFYGEEFNGEVRMITKTLWCHLVHSMHIYEDNVYMWTHSQPSGCPLTAILNSLYNSVIMRLTWNLIMSKEYETSVEQLKAAQLNNMKAFNKNVKMISYGDDNVLNISPRVIDLYNQVTITSALKQLGHTYTDEAKTGACDILSRQLSEVAFLKRSFVYNKELSRCVAPLRKDVIYEMLNWTRRTSNPDEIMMMNIETAAREMVLHGRQDFEEYEEKLKKVSDKLPYPPEIMSYGEYLFQIKFDPSNYL